MNCDSQSFVASADDMVLFLPHQVHSIYKATDEHLKYYVLKFDVGQLASKVSGLGSSKIAIHFPSMFRAAIGNPAATLHFCSKDMEDFPVRDIFHRGCTEMQNQKYGYWLMMQSHINTLLTFVLRRWRDNGFDTDQALVQSHDDSDICFITEYIDAHIHEPLKVEELAKLCNMSYSYFAKCFREMYGQSCKKYVEFMRLCKAEDLLLFTNQDMNYISQETGFSDCSHFIKAFKGSYGMTPKKYRELKEK